MWALSTGTSFNNELFYDSDNDRLSMEGFLSTELNMFNFDNIGLLTRISAFPSFTEANRWRTDFNFDIKYDLPHDLYFKIGTTFNYDNKPVEGASETDYVIKTGLGWEW